MTQASSDFELTTDELRVVARFAAESAQQVLPDYEADSPYDPRPCAALAAALAFADGAPRTYLQRTAGVAAHRAAKEAGNEIAQLAGQACGDAAAAAYLAPLAKATQVGHILRAAACAARIAKLHRDGDQTAAVEAIDSACERAAPALLDVLRRYPPAPAGTSRLAQIMSALDASSRRAGA